MMSIYNDIDDVTAHMSASSYGIQKPDHGYLARIYYTDHGVAGMVGGEVDGQIRKNLRW